MGTPFNVKARNAALDCWNASTTPTAIHRVESLLLNGNTDDYPRIRNILYELRDFADEMLHETSTLMEEDS